jgi:hypothetical protein
MLEKKPGNTDVTAMRTILLYEADFNFLNKFVGRQMMQAAECLGILAPEQYGSRRYHRAIFQAVNKAFTYDIIRQKRLTGALCSNDAKSCYDRIVHALASISMQHCGVQEPVIIAIFQTLQDMEHYIRTSFKDSRDSFGGKAWVVRFGHTFHGVGQGNGAGPAIWAIISTPVLDMLREAGFGVQFSAALSNTNIHFSAYSFVDDTDLPQVAEDGQTLDAVVKSMQDSLDKWEGGIRATGGALVPLKSHWYLIEHDFHPNGTPFIAKRTNSFELTMRGATDQQVKLQKLPNHQALRTLGVRLAPDGNMRTELVYL